MNNTAITLMRAALRPSKGGRLVGRFVLFTLCFLGFISVSFADNRFTIINHYNTSLVFTFTQNPEILPDFPHEFIVDTNKSISSRVIDGQKHTYIRTNEVGNPKHYAFWGLESVHNIVIMHGYLGEGIAYSWSNDTLTFCTPADFRQHKKCL